MTNLDQTQYATTEVKNQLLPAEGPKTIPVSLDFTTETVFALDMSQQIRRKFISLIQSVFIDNQYNDNPLVVTIGITGQVIKAKGRTQGYYPVLAPPEFTCTFSCAGVGDSPTVVYLMNMPIAPGQWATT